MSSPTINEMESFGQTDDEISLLIEHDRDEILHAFVPGSPAYMCNECGDTEEGLMHNNTWRNVEPLLVPDCGDPRPDCPIHNGECD